MILTTRKSIRIVVSLLGTGSGNETLAKGVIALPKRVNQESQQERRVPYGCGMR